MNQDPSLFNIYNKYNDSSTGKAVLDTANFRNDLRNKIHLGMQMEASKGSLSSSSNTSHSTASSRQFPQNNRDFTFRSDTTPISIGLVSSTMHSYPNQGKQYSLDLPYEISAPLSTHHNTMVKEKADQSQISVAFHMNGEYRLLEIRRNCTALELRHFLLQQHLFQPLQTLTGWRLGLDNQLIQDSVDIYTLPLVNGSVIDVISVEDDQEIVYQEPTFNSFNAACTSRNQNERYVRTIERLYNPPAIPETASDLPVVGDIPAQRVIQEEQDIPYDYFPILQRPGYYMRPDHFEMRNKTEEEVQTIQDFVVGREGAGEICWPGETDLRLLNLDERVVIEQDLNGTPYVLVYPPEIYLNTLPPQGAELNKEAIISLFNMFPRGVRTLPAVGRYEEMLKQQVEDMGGEWISYDIHTGILKFKVQHF